MRPAVPLYWRCTPAECSPFYETGLVHNEYRVTLAQLFNDVFPQHVARSISIPLRSLEQLLHAVGRGFADPLSELPAVLAFNRAEQALQVRQCTLPRLGPSEQAAQPLVQCIQFPFPRFRNCLHGLIFT
jgi:hypothetical protein